MAQGGEAGLDTLENLASMQIEYIGKRRERNPPPQQLPKEVRLMQEYVHKNPFAVPPKGMDLGYPTSIQNVTLKLEKFETESLIEKTVKKNELSYTNIDSEITKEILEHDFKIFPQQSDAIYVEQGSFNEESWKILRSPTKRPLSKIQDCDIIYHRISLIVDENFYEEKLDFQIAMSLKVKGEPAPITFLVGKDDILKAGLVNEPPTLRHSHQEPNEVTDDHLFEEVHKCKKQEECEMRNHLIYYWYHDIIKPGCVYWMVGDGNKLILHDLTKTFNMTPFITSLTLKVDKIEINAIKSAMGLMYYNSALYRWHNNRITEESMAEAIELCKRAIKIYKNDFPEKWCLANILYSNILIPLNIDLNETMLHIVIENPDETQEYRLRWIVLSHDLYEEAKRILGNSLKLLRKVLLFLVERLTAEGKLPLKNSTFPNGTHRLEFDLDTLARDLIRVDVKNMTQTFVIDELNSFVDQNDTEIRLLAYVLRKIFQDCVVQARIFQRYDEFKNMMMFCETAIAAWIGLTSVLSEERMPLPLRPIQMMGDGFYRLSQDKNSIDALKNYVLATEQIIIKDLDKINTAYNVSHSLGLIKRKKLHLYMRDSFECFARAILYSEVIPDEELLMRMCIVSNDLIFDYLERSDESSDNYTGESNVNQNLANCKLLLDVVFHLVVQFTIERQILAAAYALKVRYLRICIHQELKKGKKVDYICNEFVKVITVLDDAFADFEQLNIQLPICKSLVTFEFTVALTDYIFKLRYKEDKDKVSYHKDIITSYARYVKFCRSMFEDRIHGPYFAYRAAVGYASLAEYLFGLCRDKENDKLQAEAEKWFEEADKLFSRLPRHSAMELIKTRNDRLAFYDLLTSGQSSVLEYDSKTINILLKSLDLLYAFDETEYKLDSKDVSTNNKRIRMRGVLEDLEKRLQKAMYRRLKYKPVTPETSNTIDIPKNEIRNLHLKSLNRNRLDLLENLKDVLGEIKTLKDQNFTA